MADKRTFLAVKTVILADKNAKLADKCPILADKYKTESGNTLRTGCFSAYPYYIKGLSIKQPFFF
ncbi:hypothetical protein GCM10009865_34740 [Aeromicrobium ponti]